MKNSKNGIILNQLKKFKCIEIENTNYNVQTFNKIIKNKKIGNKKMC